jgi:hypothetical protein
MKQNGKKNGKPDTGQIQLWVDGSFQPHDGDRAGGAALRMDARGRRLDVLAYQFSSASSRFPVRESRDAERLTVMTALEAARAGTVALLGSDCAEVVPRLQEIQRGRLNTGKFNGELFDRLTAGVRQQPRMTVRQVSRNEGGIPVANAFAQAAARGDIAKMEAEARRFRVPFTFVAADGAMHQYSPAL